MTASSPAFPPPTTATVLPPNKGASQVEQYTTPLPSNSVSPGTPSFFLRLPEVTSIVLVLNSLLASVLTTNPSSDFLTSLTNSPSMMSMSFWTIKWSSSIFANSNPETDFVPIQFCISADVSDWPPNDLVITAVLIFFLAA